MTTRMSDVAEVTAMHRVAAACVAREILRATAGFPSQCRKPHGSRVFFTSVVLPDAVETLLRGDFPDARPMCADAHVASENFFHRMLSKARAEARSRSKARESVRSDSPVVRHARPSMRFIGRPPLPPI